MSSRLRWPAVIAASALGLDLLVLGSVPGPARLLAALWFFLVCTGMSFVPLLGIPTVASQLVFAVGLSVVLDTVAATVIVGIGGLSVRSGLIVLESICVLGCGLQVRSWRRVARSRG